MGLFSDSPFDFDGNGRLTPDEAIVEFMIFNEVMNQRSDDELDDELDEEDEGDF